MKTITQFSGVVLREADGVRQQLQDAEREATIEAMAAKLAIPTQRVVHLLGALEIAGKTLSTVRLVRVYDGEIVPKHGKTIEGFHYVIDRFALAKPAPKPGHKTGKGGHKTGNSSKQSRPGDRGKPDRSANRGKPNRSNDYGKPGGRVGSHGKATGSKLPSSGDGWLLTRAETPQDKKKSRRDGAPPKRKRPRRTDKKKSEPTVETRKRGSTLSTEDGTPPAKKRRRNRTRKPKPQAAPAAPKAINQTQQVETTPRRRIVVAASDNSTPE